MRKEEERTRPITTMNNSQRVLKSLCFFIFIFFILFYLIPIIVNNVGSCSIKFPCDSCDYVATPKAHQGTHIKSAHEFPCDSCYILFTEKGSLRDI